MYMRFLLFSVSLFFFPFFAFANEEITAFTSDITLKDDGTFEVVETIEYNFDEVQRHGIFRYIGKNHPQGSFSIFKSRVTELEVLGVMVDGSPATYDLTDTKNNLEIKIGDPNVTITGVHTYTISYKVIGGYSYFDDGTAEIYWNVTGDAWEIPIQSAKAVVSADSDLLGSINFCYKGTSGSTDVCDSITPAGSSSVTFSAENLEAYEGLTIAQSLKANATKVVKRESYNWVLFFVGIFVLGVLGGIIALWRYKTKYKTHKTVVAQYEPYNGVLPMYTGVLVDGNLDPRDITSGIVYLAEQGFLKIKKTEKKVLFVFEVDDYEVTLLKPSNQIQVSFLSELMSLLFDDKKDVAGSVVTLSELKNSTTVQKKNFTLITKLRSELNADLITAGFFEKLWGFAFRRRTVKGYEAQNYLQGFKLFLSMTEKERYTFHNAPEKSPEQFMEYLPYAIAFGVEKEWAEAFKDITIANPSWYDGGQAHNFSAVSLSSSLGAFSSSLATSSVSSSSSGSSGGGSSGGGGGGGGGGSW